MDPTVQALFDERILAQVADRYGVQPAAIELLGGFESFVFQVELAGQQTILRISHSSRRPAAMIHGEVEWINYLAERGVPVARALDSVNGNLVEVVEAAQGDFLAVSFEKAPGGPVKRQDWQPALFVSLGRLIGRMHRLTRDFRPGEPGIKRPEWYQESEGFVSRRLPVEQGAIVERFAALLAHLHTLPTGPESYGLVHTDVHAGNFHLDGDRLTLFDFDDCQYSWFADDIAMALFYAIPFGRSENEAKDAIRTFFSHFMVGYRQEYDLELAWFEQIPTFMKTRELAVYAAIYEHVAGDMSRLGDWDGRFMAGRVGRIANDVPVIELDFVQLATHNGR